MILLLRPIGLMLAAICAQGAAHACQFSSAPEPPPLPLLWLTAPAVPEPGESVLEVEFTTKTLGPELIPNPQVRNVEDVVVIGCGRPTAYVYQVVRVVSGDFRGDQIMIVPDSRFSAELQDTRKRPIAVGRLGPVVPRPASIEEPQFVYSPSEVFWARPPQN